MLDSYTREHVGRLTLAEPLCVDRGATLRSAASLLYANDIGLLVVTNEGSPVGVLSERDITAAIAEGVDPDTTIVGYAMSGHIFAADVSDTLLDAAVQMLDMNTRHLLIRDGSRYVGVLSIRDLAHSLLLQAMGMHPSDG